MVVGVHTVSDDWISDVYACISGTIASDATGTCALCDIGTYKTTPGSTPCIGCPSDSNAHQQCQRQHCDSSRNEIKTRACHITDTNCAKQTLYMSYFIIRNQSMSCFSETASSDTYPVTLLKNGSAIARNSPYHTKTHTHTVLLLVNANPGSF